MLMGWDGTGTGALGLTGKTTKSVCHRLGQSWLDIILLQYTSFTSKFLSSIAACEINLRRPEWSNNYRALRGSISGEKRPQMTRVDPWRYFREHIRRSGRDGTRFMFDPCLVKGCSSCHRVRDLKG